MNLIDIPTEQTTAATDALLALVTLGRQLALTVTEFPESADEP